jgi:SAM-dependent methyltransferase
MPSERAAAYVTDVPYVRQFCAELNPSLLRAVAALSGCPPPPGDALDFCEVGAGLGDTLATLAAAYPRGRFVGVDVNPVHVASARGLAARGELANVRFLERDFEDLRDGELPPLDYLCAHGLLTWIAPAKRRALFAMAAARLKPGGLFYVSYNALPGWAAVEPLRRFMLDAAAGIEGDSETRVRHALAAAQALRDARAEYFVANPSASEILATMLEMGVPYVAHEFFGPYWEPLHFADVAAEATEHDLRFVGQVPLHLNYRNLAVAPGLDEALRSITDRRALERVNGFAKNEFFRRDVYVKGAVSRPEDTTRAYLDTTLFGTLVPADDVKRDCVLPSGSLAFAGPLFEALIAAIAARGATIRELARAPSLEFFGDQAIRHAVLQLAMGKDVIPMTLRSRGAEAPGSRYRVPSAFNRAVLAQPLSPRHKVVLASPVAGTGVGLSMLHVVALRALTEPPPDQRDAWLLAFVGANPLRLVDHGDSVVDKDDVARLLKTHVDSFRASRLPKLVELGVVDAEK